MVAIVTKLPNLAESAVKIQVVLRPAHRMQQFEQFLGYVLPVVLKGWLGIVIARHGHKAGIQAATSISSRWKPCWKNLVFDHRLGQVLLITVTDLIKHFPCMAYLPTCGSLYTCRFILITYIYIYNYIYTYTIIHGHGIWLFSKPQLSLRATEARHEVLQGVRRGAVGHRPGELPEGHVAVRVGVDGFLTRRNDVQRWKVTIPYF